MLPQSLLDYLKTSKEQGFSLSELEEALHTQGWDEPMIQKAKEWYASTPQAGGSSSSIPTPPSMQPLVSAKPEADEHKPFVFVKEPQDSDSSDNAIKNSNKTSFLSSKKIMLSCIGIIIVLLLFFSTSMIMIAYGALNVGDTAFKKTVSNIVLSLPFMPKTPEYVLTRSNEAGKDVKRMSIDASFALNSPSLAKSFGVGSFDLSIKGPIDYEDPENPSLSFAIAMAKDFDLDIRLKNKTTYFRINQIPSFLSMYATMMGIPSEILQQFTNKWFSYDSKALDTEARQNLNEKENSFGEEDVERVMEALSSEKVKKELTMTTEDVEGKQMYKIHLNVTSEVLNIFEKALQKESDKDFSSTATRIKLSEYIKNMTIDEWVDESNYNLHKLVIAFKVKSPQTDAFLMPSQGSNYDMPRLSSEEIPVSLVMKFSDYGKKSTIEIPSDAIDFEEYLKSTFEAIQASGASTITPQNAY